MSETRSDAGVVADRLMLRLRGFIHGIGVSQFDARFLADRVIAAMPSGPQEEIEATARTWMLIALS